MWSMSPRQLHLQPTASELVKHQQQEVCCKSPSWLSSFCVLALQNRQGTEAWVLGHARTCLYPRHRSRCQRQPSGQAVREPASAATLGQPPPGCRVNQSGTAVMRLHPRACLLVRPSTGSTCRHSNCTLLGTVDSPPGATRQHTTCVLPGTVDLRWVQPDNR